MKQLYSKVSIDGMRDEYKIVAGEKITFKTNTGRLEKGICCSLNGYRMEPGKVGFDEEMYHFSKDEILTQIERYVYQGITTIMSCVPIASERTLEEELQSALRTFEDSPIDYVLGIRMAAERVTPEVMRKCGRYRLPFIIIEFEHESSWNNFVFEWIHQANFPYRAAMMVDFTFLSEIPESKRMREKKVCYDLLSDKGIEPYEYDIIEPHHVSTSFLMRTGLFPLKGSLTQGSHFDYNLYSNHESTRVDEEQILDYHGEEPAIIGLRGEILKVEKKLHLKRGFGERLDIRKPGFFTASHGNKISRVRRSFGSWSVLNKLSPSLRQVISKKD